MRQCSQRRCGYVAALLGALAACLLLPAAAAAAAPTADAASIEATVMQGLRTLLHRHFPDLTTRTPGWQPGDAAHHCSWERVTCKAQRVVQLSLLKPCRVKEGPCGEELAPPPAAITPPELAALARLQELRALQIFWPAAPLGLLLPHEWLQPGVWPKLNSLFLEAQMPTDAPPLPDIPPGALPSLSRLVLNAWDMQSTLPASWGSSPRVLPALQHLDMHLDMLGTLPEAWSRGFPRLRSLEITVQSRVHPGGTSTAARALPPAWAAGFRQLQALSLTEMNVTGPLPPAWLQRGSFPALHILSMSGGRLSGTLPPQLFNALPNLAVLRLPTNRFEGSLPAEWAGSQVRELTLSSNHLRGAALPAAWVQRGMPALEILDLDNNELTGALPDRLPGPKLQVMSLQGTAVQGSIPPGWCTQDASLFLKSLYIEETRVDPALPACKELEKLQVHWIERETGGKAEMPGGHGRPGLVSLLALLCLTAALAGAGMAGRQLLRRRRSLRLRAALEEQALLQRQTPSGSMTAGSAASATAGHAGWSSGSPLHGPPAGLVRRVQRQHTAAMLSSRIQQARGIIQLEALTHKLVQPAAGLASHRAHAPQQAAAAAGSLEMAALPPSLPAWREQDEGGADGAAGTAQHAQRAQQWQQWQWGLPTESIRVPATSLEFVADELGQLVELGVGSFAVVFLARTHPGGRLIAVKVLELEEGVDAAAVWQEVALMRRCRHPRIVSLLGVAIEGSLLLVAMEKMDGGTLAQALELPSGRQKLTWAQCGRQVALDIAEALDHLHTHLGVLHSDIKLHNVLLSADWRASISDLGVAQVVGGGAQVPVGFNRRYAAPEVLLGQQCTLSADVYSFGLVLVSLLTQQPLVQRVGWRLPRAPHECPQEVVSLIEGCLAYDPQQRPTAAQVLAQLRASASW